MTTSTGILASIFIVGKFVLMVALASLTMLFALFTVFSIKDRWRAGSLGFLLAAVLFSGALVWMGWGWR